LDIISLSLDSHRLPSMPNANARRAVLFAAALAAFVFLLSSAHVPCGFARIFHTPCPGCGSTRAMLALASGDLHAFVRYNPMAPFMSAIVAVLAVQAFLFLLATGTFRRVGDGMVGVLVSRGAIVVGLVEFVIWLARFGGFLGGPVPV
jgi:Protein of unknown function (DUF2752)